MEAGLGRLGRLLDAPKDPGPHHFHSALVRNRPAVCGSVPYLSFTAKSFSDKALYPPHKISQRSPNATGVVALTSCVEN